MHDTMMAIGNSRSPTIPTGIMMAFIRLFGGGLYSSRPIPTTACPRSSFRVCMAEAAAAIKIPQQLLYNRKKLYTLKKGNKKHNLISYLDE